MKYKNATTKSHIFQLCLLNALPSNKEYKKQLIQTVESFTKRLRWRALAFLGRLDPNEKETYGFRSNKCPPAVEELAELELDVMKMINSIKFRSVKNNFLSKLKNDIKTTNSTQEILVNADK